MATLSATIGELDAQRIYRMLTDLADRIDDPARTQDNKRADALVDLLLPTRSPELGGAFVADTGPGAACECGGVAVNVTIALPTLLGLNDDPGHVEGLGPIAADQARALSSEGPWRAWITDAAACTVIATGSSRYTPSAALVRLIQARDRVCRMPGCHRRAVHCDIDHAVPWPRGATDADNLGALCRRHHNLKTHWNYRLTTGDDGGGFGWTTPAGITTNDEPPPPP